MQAGFAYRQPLYHSLICPVGSEKRVQGVVARSDEGGEVNEELAVDVEEHEEEVEGGYTENGVYLGYRCLPLEVGEGGVVGELEQANVSHAAFRMANAKMKLRGFCNSSSLPLCRALR